MYICIYKLVNKKNRFYILRKYELQNVRIRKDTLPIQGAAIDPPDKSRRTPLYQATSKGAVDTVGFLLKRGADVTVKTIQLRSVIHAAVPFPNVMELLLRVVMIISNSLQTFLINHSVYELLSFLFYSCGVTKVKKENLDDSKILAIFSVTL